MKSISIISNVKNGKLSRNRNKIIDAIASFEAKDIEITIKRKRKQRSNNQNAYYHGVLVPIMVNAAKDLFGEIWSNTKAHEFLKNQFLFHETVNQQSGEIIKTPKSTTECTTVEFEEYQTTIREFLMEFANIDVPLPNQELTIKF
ncbi:MAG: hypothetical protein ACWA5P_02110 [bacterium]